MDNHKNRLSILCWNAQGIRSKLTEFFYLLQDINIDICLISETWLNQGHRMATPDYSIYRNDRHGRLGGGVAICIKNSISHRLLPDFKTKTIESIGVEVQGPQSKVILIAVYFPGTALSTTKLKQFKADLKVLTSLKNSFLVCGDLNAKHRAWNCVKANQAGKIVFDETTNRDLLVQFTPTPTYFPPQKNRIFPSTIDIVITNGICNLHNLCTKQALTSDHLPISFEIEMTTNTNSTKKPIQCFSKANWSIFKSFLNNALHLREVDPENLRNAQQIDTAIVTFRDCVKEAEQISVPKIEVRNESIQLTPYILSLISIRNLLRRQWQRTRLLQLKTEVNHYNKLIKSNIFHLRNLKWNKKLSSFNPGDKQFWTTTKFLTKASKSIPPLKNRNNEFLLTDHEKAAEIAESFNKAHGITFHNKSNQSTESLVAASVQNVRFFNSISNDMLNLPKPHEVHKIIRNLNNRKSPGDDAIKNITIKHLPKKGIVYLTQIYRACFRLSYFPNEWKHAKIIAIPKPGKDLTNPSNYRPISLLSTLSKILEKIVLGKINLHLRCKDIIIPEQFGFREGLSTNHQLLRVTNHIKTELANKRSTGVLTFDIEKAFDCVWHNALIHKMFKLKFPLHLIKLIQSFLHKRSFYVSINIAKSNSFNIQAGVPQGSVLSPTLFNIFTSDINISTPSCEIALFADDTAIYCSGKNPNKIISSLNAATTQLSNYCFTWKIKLNAAKTQATFFTKRKCERMLPSSMVIVDGAPTPWTNNIKYLGVYLDKSLTYKIHVEYAVERALKYIKILYSLINRKSKLSVYNKLLIYKTIFQSILLYACPIWGNCAACHKYKLQVIQNKCLKIMLNLPYSYPTSSIHKMVNVRMINDQIFKIRNNFIGKLHSSSNPLVRCLLQNESNQNIL